MRIYEDLLAARNSEGKRCKKVSYLTPAAATGHRYGLSKKGLNTNVYRCSICGYYHVTTCSSK